MVPHANKGTSGLRSRAGGVGEQLKDSVVLVHAHPCSSRGPAFHWFLARTGLLLLFAGCASAPLRAPLDLSGPGWTVREGQAVWQAGPTAPGVAGELLVATHADGSSLQQFIKPPLPFVLAQQNTN